MTSVKVNQARGYEIRIMTLFMVLALASFGFSNSAWAGDKGPCPQPRKTKSAPANIVNASIPASASVEAGKKIFEKSAKPMACKMCHGSEGNGAGKLGKALKPQPRNFTCSATMKSVLGHQKRVQRHRHDGAWKNIKRQANLGCCEIHQHSVC